MSDSDAGGLDTPTLLKLTTQIVSAYAGNTTVSATELTEVIGTVSRALVAVGRGSVIPVVEALVPAVSIKKSVTPDFIICLEDGKKLKMLKRHLMSTYGITPAQYRTKWNLPSDYPMVAPNYAATRSRLAKKIGLGKYRPASGSKPAVRRGRPRKAPAA